MLRGSALLADDGTPNLVIRTLSLNNVQQIWLVARLKEGDYAIVNHASPTAIGATGGMFPT